MFLEELTGALHFEGKDYECKLILDRENTLGWLKTIAGFSNADGGTLYIGVEDQTNKLIGFDRAKADQQRNFLNNQINEHITPRPQYHVSFVPYEIHGKERIILEVAVAQSPVRPVVVKADGVPAIYMRREGFTNGATYEEIIQMSIASQTASYDILPSDLPYQRRKFSKLLRFHEEHTEGKILTDKALASLGFFDADQKLANGAVLFSDDYNGNKTAVQCSVFSGKTKGSQRIVTVNRFQGSLTDSIAFMYDFVTQRMNRSVIKHSTEHVLQDAFPLRALYEGIINAVAHRDYFLDGTQIQIDLFQDRLEISSPGGFYQGGLTGKTYDLATIISKRRNELICGVLVKCAVMEAAGTGFDKVAEDYSNADRAHQPFVYSASDHFTLTLPDLTWQPGLDGYDLPEVVFIPIPDGSQHDAAILAFCYQRERTGKEIAEMLHIANSTYFRDKILGNLVEHGLLKKRKVSKSTSYIANPEKVSRIG